MPLISIDDFMKREYSSDKRCKQALKASWRLYLEEDDFTYLLCTVKDIIKARQGIDMRLLKQYEDLKEKQNDN